jgi:hypothetical protein
MAYQITYSCNAVYEYIFMCVDVQMIDSLIVGLFI